MSLTSQDQNADNMPGFTTESGHIPVRDRRGKNWHWKLNLLHDEFVYNESVITFSAVIGASACLVYDYLCRRADEETQTCFPSVPTVSFITGLSDSTATDMLSLLCWHGMIQRVARDAEEGDPTSNLYILLPVERWAIEGGKSEVRDELEATQRKRLERMLKRKAPYAIRKKHFPNSQVTVKVVQNLGHPLQKNSPRVVQILGHPGLEIEPPVPQNADEGGSNSGPPLDQDSLGGDSVVKPQNKQEATSASQIVVGENQDFLSEQTETETPQVTTKQFALPYLGGVSLPFKASQSAIDMARRLQIWGKAEGMEIDEPTAAHIVLRNVWGGQLVHMNEAKIKRLIGADWKEAGLSSAIGGQAKTELSEDVDLLRWNLWIWPLQRGEVEAYYERANKTADLSGAFIRHCREEKLPSGVWLQEQVAAIAAEARAKEQAARREAAEAVWDGLNEFQQAQVIREAEARANGTGNWNDMQKRKANQRDLLLLEADWVASLPTQPVALPVAAPAEIEPGEIDQAYQPDPKAASRLEFHFDKILSRLNMGVYQIEEVEDLCLALAGFGPRDLRWLAQEVKEEWGTRQRASKAA